MEAWFSDCVKWDFPESECDALRNLVKSTNIPPTLYASSALRPSTPTVPFDVPDDDGFDSTADMDPCAGISAEDEQLLPALNAQHE
jgi:hypothetical protein